MLFLVLDLLLHQSFLEVLIGLLNSFFQSLKVAIIRLDVLFDAPFLLEPFICNILQRFIIKLVLWCHQFETLEARYLFVAESF